MLKETEATTVFFVTFLSWVAVQLGGGLWVPPGYAYNLSSLTVASKKKSSKLTLPVNFSYLFTKSDLKVKSNIVLEGGISVIMFGTSAS